MKRLYKKSIKTTGIIVMCMILLCSMFLNIFAYQADFVKKENHFGDGNIFYGRLYIYNDDDSYYPIEGSAETYITTYTDEVEEILVQYWFEGFNATYENSVVQIIAAPGNKSTQSFTNTIERFNIDSFHGLHKVNYYHYRESEQWWDYTIEEGL